MRKRLARTVACAAAILVAGIALGLSANALSDAGIPLVKTVAPLGRTISLADAHSLFVTGDAQFVDARPHEDFVVGHVTGARNVPWAARAVRLDALLSEVPRTRPIVVYCDGGDCESAADVSAWLAAHGWRNVRVLDAGYPVWEAAGFPVASGEER